MSGQEFTEQDRFRLNHAWRRLFKAYGGVDAAAMAVGRDRSQVSRWGSPHEVPQPPVDAVAILEREVGPIVTTELAWQARHLLIPLPPVEGDSAWLNHLAQVTQDTAQVAGDLSRALAGHVENGVAGTITADESRTLGLRARATEAMAHLAALEQALAALEAGA